MDLFSPPKFLAAIGRDQRSWPMIFRSSRKGDESSVPDALYSATEHIEEAEEHFAKLADEYLPRMRDEEIEIIVEALSEAKREIHSVRAIIESLWQLVRPWHRKPKD